MSMAKAVLLAAVAAWPCGVALAQTGGGASAATGAAPVGATAVPPGTRGQPQRDLGDEIIVTAQKREQRLIDVPQSVSVVSAQQLQQVHAERFDDFLTRIPSAAVDETQAGLNRLILRGINTGSADATVATYVDETPFGSATSLANGATLTPDLDPTDIDRIEVLRGPQGTLYGANSLGGLIKFVTVQPTTDGFHGLVEGTLENVQDGNLGRSGRAALNVPLGTTLAIRGSGYYRRDPGFIDDPIQGHNVNDGRTYGGRFSALFKPDDRLTLRGSATLQNIASNGTNTEDVDPSTLRPTIGRYEQSHIISEPNDVRYRIYNGTGTYDFGGVKLLSSSSWGNLDDHQQEDGTGPFGALLTGALGTPLGAKIDNAVRQRRFTQEVRLSANEPSWLDWTLGGYYTRERNRISQLLSGIDGVSGAEVSSLPALETIALYSRYREYAGFANGTIHFTPQLELALGGRYSHNQQSFNQDTGGLLVPPSTIVGHTSDNVFTYSVAPTFKPNNHLTVYARVARGYRPGGPNVVPALAADAGVPTEFGPDRTTNYEIGVKTELLDRRLTLELTGFYIDWRDVHLLDVTGGTGVVINGGKARSRGIEFSATANPVRGLTLSANGAYVDAYLTQDASNGGQDGDALPYVPRFSSTVSADYERPLNGAVNGTVGVSWRYTGRRSTNFDSGHQRLNDFSQVDAHAGVTFDKYRVDAFVRNLSNSHGILDVSTLEAENGALAAAVNRPRSYGLTVGVRY